MLVAVLSASACATPTESPPWNRPGRVFLVTIDTLRADHLEVYGYPRNTAPSLSTLAERSVVFRNTISSSSHTNPSHASIFTGLHPPQHKLLYNGQAIFPESIQTLAELFSEVDYDTVGIYSVPWLDVFRRGFRTFRMGTPTGSGQIPYVQASDTVDLANSWLSTKTPSDAFFIWVHFYDPHKPYRAPERFQQALQFPSPQARRRLLSHWREAQDKDPQAFPWGGNLNDFVQSQTSYDAEIRFVDAELERFYTYAEQKHLLHNSLWIITADHGQGLGSHGFEGHGMYIYQEQLTVPLLIHHPDGAFPNQVVQDLVQHVDIFPTLADALGISSHRQILTTYGRSLLPTILGDVESMPPRYAFAQRRKKFSAHNFTRTWEDGPIFSLQDRHSKYIVHTHGTDELYDLRRDPNELNNLIGEGSVKEMWRRRALEIYAQMAEEAESLSEPRLSDRHREALKALGYLR